MNVQERKRNIYLQVNYRNVCPRKRVAEGVGNPIAKWHYGKIYEPDGIRYDIGASSMTIKCQG